MPGFLGQHVFGKKFTIARVSFEYKHPKFLQSPRGYADNVAETIDSVGEAQLAPGDKYDEEVAYLLAYGRALESLGKKLQKRAWSIVSQRDNDKIQRKNIVMKKRLEEIRQSAKSFN